MGEPDPIADLVAALEREDRPTLAWVTRWRALARGGRDPVRAAWSRAHDANAMAALRVYTGAVAALQVTVAARGMGGNPRGVEVPGLPNRWVQAPVVRVHVRTHDARVINDATGEVLGVLRAIAPPSLAQLLEVRRG